MADLDRSRRQVMGPPHKIAVSSNMGNLTQGIRHKQASSQWLGGTLLHLNGIDAPELPQSCGLGPGQGGYFCGAIVRGVLVQMTMGKRFFCSIERRQGDDRNWGVCGEANAAGTANAAGKLTLNEEMVRAGWAVVDRRVSVKYLDLQIQADNDNVGLWQGTFTNPREWRLGFR